jgi:hypothetical protein
MRSSLGVGELNESAKLLPSALPNASVAIRGPDVNGRSLKAKTQVRCGLAGRSAQVH